jgi:alpha-mannosidase
MGGESHLNMPVPVAKDYPKLAAGPVGKQIHSIYQSRLRQFLDAGQYKEQSLIG